jgi:hypothetical protein
MNVDNLCSNENSIFNSQDKYYIFIFIIMIKLKMIMKFNYTPLFNNMPDM